MSNLVRMSGEFLVGVPVTLADGTQFIVPATAAVSASGGAVGGTVIAGGSFNRPADTTAYAVGDLIANSTAAASVLPISVAAASGNGGAGAITGVRLSKTNPVITNAIFRVHFFKGLAAADGNGHFVTVANGDNGLFSANIVAALHIGFVDIDMTTIGVVGSDGAKGEAAPARAVMAFDADASRSVIYALIEARGAYTPTSGETFTVAAEITQG